MHGKQKTRRIAPGRLGLFAAACMLGAGIMTPAAQAGGVVEYVRTCPEVGDEFHYLPGTDTCLNPSTNDARQETAGGTWRWRMPNNPIEWVQAPRKICRGGRLIEFGTLDSSDLVINDFSRLEATTALPLTLGDREYVSSAIYKGDLVGAGGDFCLFYHYVDVVEGSVYQPLGCGNPSSNARHAALLSYAPDIQPPDTTNPVFLVAAGGKRSPTPVPATITGSLNIWVCIKKTKAGM